MIIVTKYHWFAGLGGNALRQNWYQFVVFAYSAEALWVSPIAGHPLLLFPTPSAPSIQEWSLPVATSSHERPRTGKCVSVSLPPIWLLGGRSLGPGWPEQSLLNSRTKIAPVAPKINRAVVLFWQCCCYPRIRCCVLVLRFAGNLNMTVALNWTSLFL